MLDIQVLTVHQKTTDYIHNNHKISSLVTICDHINGDYIGAIPSNLSLGGFSCNPSPPSWHWFSTVSQQLHHQLQLPQWASGSYSRQDTFHSLPPSPQTRHSKWKSELPAGGSWIVATQPDGRKFQTVSRKKIINKGRIFSDHACHCKEKKPALF